MLFLVLFAVLAIGFIEAEMINVQISRNEKTGQQALTAADSGMSFIRYHLSAMTLPPGTDSTNLLARVAAKLGSALNTTGNMGGATVAVVNNQIDIPSASGWITHDPLNMGRFRVTIKQSGTTLIVQSHGTSGSQGLLRGTQLNFVPAPRPYALMGLNSMTLSGSAFTDSYDATKGAYSAATAKHGGSIGSNGNITLNNTAKVDGEVRYGAGASTSIAPTATVTGVIAPMRSPVTYASVTLPPAGTYTDLGDVTMSSGTMTVPAGTYVINKLTLSGTAATFPTINWNGPVKLYIKTSYSVTGKVIINTYQNLPVNRQLYFLPTCTTATWTGSNVCVGDLYAPDTDFTVGGTVEKFGRVIAKSITNSSSKGMHYDESLPAPNGQMSYSPDLDTYLEIP
jgi:hypothetical protein